MSTTFYRGENPLHADKLNTAFSERVSRGGDTMQGFLTLAADPVQPFDAATKQYVDRFTAMGVPTGAYIGASPPGNTLAPLWWDNVSGQLFIQYNDGSSTQWVSANSTYSTQLPLAGGVLTGPLYWTATGSTASRSAQDRSADGVNALDHGVLLDGSTNNTAFLNAARVAAKHNGSVFLPAGLIHGPLTTTAGPTTAVLWKLDGTTFPDGATPIQLMGAPGDTVESYYNGYKFFGKQANPVGALAPVVRIDLTQNLTGAGGGGIAYGLNVNATQTAGDTALVYALEVVGTTSADLTAGGMAGIQSTVSKSGGAQAWAIQTVTRDTTGLASSANGRGMVGIETAIRAVALDDASNALTWGGLGNRVALHLSLTLPVGTASGTEAQFSQGIRVSGDAAGTKCYVNSVYGVDLNVDTYQVFDARGAGAPWNYGSNPVAALRMAAGQVVDFNGGPALNSAPGSYLQYRTATSRLYYVVAGVDQWSVDASGNVRARGTFTGSTTP